MLSEARNASLSVLVFLQDYNGAITAFATCIIGLFTVVLVLITNRQAKLTAASVRIAEKALVEVERAFIFIEGFDVELTTAMIGGKLNIPIEKLPERYRSDPGIFITRFATQPRWKNEGNTAARNLITRVHWSGPGGRVPPDYEYPNRPQSLFIAPQGIERTEVIDMSAAPRALVDFGAFFPGGAEPNIFIWGRADYEDVFGVPHFMEWCYRLRIDRHDGKELRTQFIQWGEHNRTDESAK